MTGINGFGNNFNNYNLNLNNSQTGKNAKNLSEGEVLNLLNANGISVDGFVKSSDDGKSGDSKSKDDEKPDKSTDMEEFIGSWFWTEALGAVCGNVVGFVTSVVASLYMDRLENDPEFFTDLEHRW